MTDRTKLKALLRRPVEPGDLPIVIGRRRWAILLSAVALPLMAALGGLAIWIAFQPDLDLEWPLRVFPILLGLLIALGAWSGIDFLFGYRLAIDNNGISLGGTWGPRRFEWGEIEGFDVWRMRVLALRGPVFTLGYQAVIQVDGSRNPKRSLRNLYFKGHFVAPYMELGGKELAALLTKAKRQLERADPSPPDANAPV